MSCARRTSIDRHFDGTIGPREERAMREHLPGCDDCRAYYDRHALLSQLDPDGLGAEERLARGLGFGRRPARVYLGALAGLAAAAAVALFFAPRGRRADEGFTARGAVTIPAASHVLVYEVAAQGAPELAGDTIHAGSELAFAYENGAAKRRLMVFAVDARQRVYWFYPAWESAADDPAAIPIELDAQRHELPEAVRQHFEAGRIEVRALFLDEPMTVRDVESLLRDHPAGPLPIPGAVESSTSFAVVP